MSSQTVLLRTTFTRTIIIYRLMCCSLYIRCVLEQDNSLSRANLHTDVWVVPDDYQVWHDRCRQATCYRNSDSVNQGLISHFWSELTLIEFTKNLNRQLSCQSVYLSENENSYIPVGIGQKITDLAKIFVVFLQYQFMAFWQCWQKFVKDKTFTADFTVMLCPWGFKRDCPAFIRPWS